jgi:hypothetical protein
MPVVRTDRPPSPSPGGKLCAAGVSSLRQAHLRQTNRLEPDEIR